jgi:hypothetical protein
MLLNALRDFADGLSRGLSLFVTGRYDFTDAVMTPALTARRRR